MEVKFSQLKKACIPILFTLLGISIEVRPVQPAKASNILVTLLGMTVFLHPAINVLEAVSMRALQLSRESYTVFSESTLIELKFRHPEKILYSINTTFLGMITEVRPVPEKAPIIILFTLLGMSIVVRLKQPVNILNFDNQLVTF